MSFLSIIDFWVTVDEPIPQLGVVNIFGALEVSKYLYKFYGFKFKSKWNKKLKEN